MRRPYIKNHSGPPKNGEFAQYFKNMHAKKQVHGKDRWPNRRKGNGNGFKVTVHLQGCLACKRCSASGLNCRHLKPYIKLKLIGLLSYQTIPKFLRKNELSNSSRLLNASARITFWALHVKANFVFRLFNVFLRFRGQSAKKRACLWFAIFNLSEKLQNISQ